MYVGFQTASQYKGSLSYAGSKKTGLVVACHNNVLSWE